MLTHRTKAAFLLTTTLGLGWSVRASAATLTYPSASAPCNATLQACIDGAASGDRIEIATANRIDENITISNSLTLTGAPGIVPLLGSADPASTKYLDVTGNGVMLQVELRRLKLDGAYITAYFGLGKDNDLTIADCDITNAAGSTSSRGIDLDVRSPGKIRVEHNTVRTDGYGISLYTGYAGEGTFDILGNTVTSITKTKSASGLDLSLRGAGNVLVNVADNVIYSVADCNCGGAAGIEVSALETVTARTFLTNNTLVDIQDASGFSVHLASPTATLETYIFNNIVSGAETAVRFDAAQPTLTITDGYNDFYGALGASYVGGYPLASTDLDVSPGFVDTENHDYRLASNSPLVEAAMSLPPGGLSLVDADDHVRTSGAGVDIGAYEMGAVASSDLKLSADAKLDADGANLTFTLHVAAEGPSVAADVNVTLPLPKGAAFVSAKTSAGACTGTDTVTCALGRLGRAGSADIIVVASLSADAAGETIAKVESTTGDPRLEDNSVVLTLAGSAPVNAGGTPTDNAPAQAADAKTGDSEAPSESGCSVSRSHPTSMSAPASGAVLLGFLAVAGLLRGRKRPAR